MTLITESREICEFENEESVNTTCSSTTPMLGRARMVGGGGGGSFPSVSSMPELLREGRWDVLSPSPSHIIPVICYCTTRTRTGVSITGLRLVSRPLTRLTTSPGGRVCAGSAPCLCSSTTRLRTAAELAPPTPPTVGCQWE